MNKLAVVLVVVALLAMGGTEGLAQREQVRIGISLPLTGPASASGKAAEAGYRLALDEINKAGGVLGSRLQIFIEDDGNLPAKAVPIFLTFR